MLTLNLPTEPYWLDLAAGVRVKVRPFTTVLLYSAQAITRKSLQRLQGQNDTGLDINQDEVLEGVRLATFLTALARLAILDWEGVLAPDSEEKAPVNDTTVGDLLRFYPIADAFQSQYSGARELLEAEKKPLPNTADGISAAETPTAEPAPMPV